MVCEMGPAFRPPRGTIEIKKDEGCQYRKQASFHDGSEKQPADRFRLNASFRGVRALRPLRRTHCLVAGQTHALNCCAESFDKPQTYGDHTRASGVGVPDEKFLI